MAIDVASQSLTNLAKKLQQKQTLADKARKLVTQFRSVLGPDVPIEVDWVAREPENDLSVKIGYFGQGECTRHFLESLLENQSWVESVVWDMKKCLDYVKCFLREVDALFHHVREWVTHRDTAFKVEEKIIEIEESFTGKYSATMLLVGLKERKVEIRPRGAWFLGTEGRVDLIGRDQSYILAFTRKEGWQWVDESLVVRLQPLTKNLFLRLVKDCME